MAYFDDITVKDAEFAFQPNFDGFNDNYRPADDNRYFQIRLNEKPELMERLKEMGCRIGAWTPRDAEPDTEPVYSLKVKSNFYDETEYLSRFNPVIWRVNESTGSKVLLDKSTVGGLDRLSRDNRITGIPMCTLRFREYGPTPMAPNGGVSVYLKKMIIAYRPDEIDEYIENFGKGEEEVPF